MSECEACIYELMEHSNGKIIKLMCREGSRCPFYKPKAEVRAELEGADDE